MRTAKPSIDLRHLSFSWPGQPPVCRDVQLQIPRGSAFGLLGPNGVGKSTLFKLILGLLPAEQGTIELLGEPLPKARSGAFARIGSMIEEPQFYPHLSGWDNLLVTATYCRLPAERIGEVLAQTGLTAAAHRRVGHYSTGMKQRLGIARALLPRPELLILDEPTNGLDPQGIAEVRSLLRRLHREAGCTLLISSHILSEIEQLCTHAAILHDGRIARQGAIADLRRDGGGHHFRLEVADPAAAQKVLTAAHIDATVEDDAWLRFQLDASADLDRTIDLLRAQNLSIRQLIREESSLESVYLKMLNA
jgi:ABC-2 type transport system ATP-binding protein